MVLGDAGSNLGVLLRVTESIVFVLFSTFLWLGLVFCLLFLLFYVICTPLLTESTKIIDHCMDLEPCLKVHNLIVFQLNNTKLGEITNRNPIIYMVGSMYKLDKICDSTQCPAQPQSGLIMSFYSLLRSVTLTYM